MIIKCPICGKRNPDGTAYCQKCGTWLIDKGIAKQPRIKRLLLIIGALAAIAAIIGVVIVLTPEFREMIPLTEEDTPVSTVQSTQTPVAAPLPTPTPAPDPKPTPSPTPTPTPIVTLAPHPLLRQRALDVINAERGKHGLAPVALGTNFAAQSHAEDMLEHRYGGHWWMDGKKPYMVYTEMHGYSYVNENVAVSGWDFQQLKEDNCASELVICGPIDPEVEIELSTLAMIYDDAHADWGHRDNILTPSHRTVNIGVAYDETYFAFVQHFEGGDVVALQPPVFSGTTLAFTLQNVTGKFGVREVISVYYDPPPSPKTVEEISALPSYCVGGGFRSKCDDPAVAFIIPPPPPNSNYGNLETEIVVADLWTVEGDTLTVQADLGDRAANEGYYTIIVFADESSAGDSEVLLVGLSAWK